jgi:hypothetical protein
MFASYLLLLNLSIVVISAVMIIVPAIVLAHMDSRRDSVSATALKFNPVHSHKAV